MSYVNGYCTQFLSFFTIYVIFSILWVLFRIFLSFSNKFFFIFSALNQQPVPGGTGCWLFNLYFELCGTCGGSFLIWTAKGLGLFVREELSLELLQIGLRLFYFFFLNKKGAHSRAPLLYIQGFK